MKRVLKLTALMLTVALIFASFAACGKDKDDDEKRIKKYEKSTAADVGDDVNNNGENNSENGILPDNLNGNQPDNDNNEKATLKMGTNAAFSPYEYYSGGEIVGIDIEIAALIAEKLGMELEIVDMDFNGIIAAVQNGSIDMGMAGIVKNAEKEKSVNFSIPYTTNTQVVIVKADSDIRTIDDLFGKKIGVQEATTGDAYATADFGEDAVTRFNNGADAVVSLNNGMIDAVIIDEKIAETAVASEPDFVILETEYAVEEYSIAVAKDNPELLEKINKAVEELQEEGKIDGIVDKYIR